MVIKGGLWVGLWVCLVCVGDGLVGIRLLDSGCHELSENIWFVYGVKHHKVEKWSYEVGCGWVLWVWWVCVGDW